MQRSNRSYWTDRTYAYLHGYSPAMATDATHDPELKSWVESANDPETDFPIQNLAMCTFERSHDGHSHAHNGVRIGDQVLDVSMLVEAGYFQGDEMLGNLLRYSYWG